MGKRGEVMSAITNRLAVILSWWALVHAVLLIIGLTDEMNSSLPIPTSEVGRFISDYASIYQNEFIYYGFAPTVWVLLYLVTGRVAILPWRR
jgi:hypothetical protein